MKLTEVMDQMNVTDFYRTFHPQRKENTFLLALHSTFTKIDHIIGHKTDIKRYKKIKIIPCVLSACHKLRLFLNCLKKKKERKKAHIHVKAEEDFNQ